MPSSDVKSNRGKKGTLLKKKNLGKKNRRHRIRAEKLETGKEGRGAATAVRRASSENVLEKADRRRAKNLLAQKKIMQKRVENRGTIRSTSKQNKEYPESSTGSSKSIRLVVRRLGEEKIFELTAEKVRWLS